MRRALLLASLAMLLTLVLAMPATADYHSTQQAPAAAQTTTAPLPSTGGPSLVLLAGALLIGGGLILRGRRS